MARLYSAASLVMAGTAMLDSSIEAFSTNGHIQTWASPRQVSRTRPRPSSSSKLSMYIDGADSTNLLNTLSTTAFVLPPSSLLSTPTAAFMADPTIEAEVLNDMSHIALDMATFFGPATAALRLFAVIGRVLAMSADYVPDHSILGEEFLFQIFMLAIACHGLIKSAAPILVAASLNVTSFRDGRTYQALFAPTGVSWLQYKTIMATTAMEYITVEPNSIVTTEEGNLTDDDDNMYWLYSGEVQVMSQGQTIQTISRKGTCPRLDEANCMAILGGMRFVRKLDERNHNKNNKAKIKKSSSSPSYPTTTVKAGSAGATLLRINTSKLMKLMDNDEQLAQSIRSLLVTEMQEKLSALLASSNKNGNKNGTIAFLQANL